MKQFLYIILLTSGLVTAQGQDNRFEQSEQIEGITEDTNPSTDPPVQRGPGNPGPKAPIDDYIPLLVAAAIGLIVFKKYKNRAVS